MIGMWLLGPCFADPPEGGPPLPTRPSQRPSSERPDRAPSTGPVAPPETPVAPPRATQWSEVRSLPQRLSEISGLVWTEDHPDRVYGHNDSGDKPTFYAIGLDGRILDQIFFRGAKHADWEDAFLTHFNGQTQIWAADIGDNLARRSEVVLYAADLVRPTVAAIGGSPQIHSVQPHVAIRLRYPDGPRDCEAIAFDHRNRRVVMVTKTALPWCRIYVASLDSDDLRTRAERNPIPSIRKELRHVGNLAMPMVTALDIHPKDGRWLVVNYFHSLIFTPDPTGAVEVWKQFPVALKLPAIGQIEAACWSQHDRITVAGEGSPPRWAQSDPIR